MTEQPHEARAPRLYTTVVEIDHPTFQAMTPEQLASHGATIWLQRAAAVGYTPIFQPVEGSEAEAVHMSMNLRSPDPTTHYLHISGPVTHTPTQLP